MGKVTPQQLEDDLREKIEFSAFKTVYLKNSGKLSAAGSVINIGIPEYNADTDALIAYVGGLIQTETLDYTIDKVNKTLVKIAGDDGTQWEINTYYDIIVFKNIRVLTAEDTIDGGVITAGSIKRTSIDAAFQSDLDAINAKGIPYGGVTTNAGNVYSLAAPTITALTDGLPVSLKCNADSTGAVSVNWDGKGAKPVLKPNGAPVTNWKANGIYTLRYNLSNTSFIQQGEGGSGNATASNLLSGKTASTDAGDIVGTMPILEPYAPTTNYYSAIDANYQVVDQTGVICFKIPKHSYTGECEWISWEEPTFHNESILAGRTCFGVAGIATADANAIAGDLLSGKTAYVNGNKITGTVANHNNTTLSYSANEQSYVVESDPTDPDYRITVTLNNINPGMTTGTTKHKVQLWGISPRYVAAGMNIGHWNSTLKGTFTSDANAVATDILSGKTAYVNGTKITGTMVNNSTIGNTQNLTTQNQVYTIPAGYQGGSWTVKASITNLIASNIKSGVTVGGIVGTAPDGTGMKKYQSGTTSSTAAGLVSVTGLGFTPSLIVIYNATYNYKKTYSSYITQQSNILTATSGIVDTGAWTVSNGSFSTTLFNQGVGLSVTWEAYGI